MPIGSEFIVYRAKLGKYLNLKAEIKLNEGLSINC